MTRKILAIDAAYEELSKDAHAFRETNILPYLEQQGFQVVRLVGPQATFASVRDILQDPSIAFITASGHGSDDSLQGYFDDPLFQTGNPYPGSVAGRLMHFLSCGSASLLGKDLVDEGCAAFIGYGADFTYDRPSAPTFFECDGEIDKALADGCSVAQAIERASTIFQSRIATAPNARLAGLLQFDLDHLTSPLTNPLGTWGDPNARL
jgi:hypothetical protein